MIKISKLNIKQNPFSLITGLKGGFALQRGFTLIEVLVSMLIMSLFFMASTKVLTMKQKTEFQKNPHGFYECYKLSNGDIYEHRKDGNQVTAAYKTTTGCVMVPPKGVSFANIHYINPTTKTYYNSQEPIFNEEMNLSRPENIETQLGEVGINTGNAELDAELREEQWTADKNAFKTYLSLSHADSDVYANWLISGDLDTPPVAVFVAW